MTAHQLTLDDCDPTWDDLCDLGAQQLHDPVKTIYWDLRHQGLTPLQIHRIQTIKTQGSYL
ncbi:hypothetical protein [Streptomyces sp. NPDC093060]|uniref:hypothetical protein n=1 Tax=Streptomyces sp. NPDC093060 TaxID=3366019 RepID=UPI0037FE723F